MDFRRLNREDFSRPELIDPIYFNGEVDLWSANSQPRNVPFPRKPSKPMPTIEEEAQAFEDSPKEEEKVHVSECICLCVLF